MIDNIYVMNEDEITDEITDDEKSEIYYIPFFEHPIPLVHLKAENPFGMQIKVYVCFEEEYKSGNDFDIYTLSTVLNGQFRNWLKNRNLLLTLKDSSDLLRVNKKTMKIITI